MTEQPEIPTPQSLEDVGLVTPQPLPVQAHVAVETGTNSEDGGPDWAVVLTMSTPAGLSYYYLTPDGAHKLAVSIMKNARSILAMQEARAKPKLIIPNGKIVIPDA